MPEQPDPSSVRGLPLPPPPAPGQPPANPSTVDQEATGEPIPPILTAADLPALVGRYRIEGEIARGGMGAVLRAHDPEFNRTLALKILLDRLRGSPELEGRFLEEAGLTARLQHPGVPPVHDRGRLPDGRPFFAMKLVMGRTLTELLRQRPSPGHELPKFLHIFGQVCQTLGYAHAQGIIHRDLKPGNVMVGAFAEVQVMDWGLAKALRPPPGSGRRGADGQAGDADTDPGMTEETPESYTQAGQLLGTPAYMAPEQARGEIDNLDERCDVFGLGAILCVILTGAPPFRGPTAYQVAWQAMAGDVDEAFARLDACGADPELVRLAKDCLAPRQEDRLRDAGAVARAVASYQEAVQERLRLAELERARAEVRAREDRRRRRVALGLLASLLVSGLLGLGGWLWLQSQEQVIERQAEERRAERARQEAVVGKALQEVESLMDRFRWAQARAVLEQADSLLGKDGPEDLKQRLRRAAADVKLADDLDRAALAAATYMDGRADHPRANQLFWDTFAGAGLVRAEGEAPEAVADRVRGSAIRARLVAALEEWAYHARGAEQRGARWRWLLEIARRAGDADAWLQRFRDPAAWSRPKTLRELAQQAAGRRLAPQTVGVLGELLGHPAGTEFLRAAVKQYPDDFWINYTLGLNLVMSQPEEALGYCRAALAVRPDHSGPQAAMAYALYQQRKYDEGLALCEQALQRDPDDAYAHLIRSVLLQQQGRPGEALVACRRAVALAPQSFSAHGQLGTLLLGEGKLDEAEASLRQAAGLAPHYAHIHANLGLVLERKGRTDEAMFHYRQAADRAPHDAQGHSYLANALWLKGRTDEALAAYRKAIPLDSRVPGIHRYMGDRLRERGRPQEAESAFRRAIVIDPRDLAAHIGLGNALHGQKKYAEAEAACRRALEIDPKHANAYNDLGRALHEQKKYAEAEAAYHRALEIDPKHPVAHHNLGNALHEQKKDTRAEAAYRRALEIDPRYVDAHIGLGNALHRQKKYAEAEAAYRRAVALDPRDLASHHGLGNALFDQGRLREAEAAFRKGVEIAPKDPNIHDGLGFVLDRQGRLDEAAAEYREAATLGPKYARAPFNLGDLLVRQGRLDEAIAQFRQATEIEPRYVEAHWRLGLSLRDKGQLEDAIAAFRKVGELDPKHKLGHYELGNALYKLDRFAEAVTSFRRAIAIDPNYAEAHYHLGIVLDKQSKFAEAAAAYRRAIASDPNHAEAHCNLGLALVNDGRYEEGVPALRRGHELGSRRKDWGYPSAAWLAESERRAALDRRVSAVLQGKDRPKDGADLDHLALFCAHGKKRVATAARLWAKAFRDDPKLAYHAGNRYEAARTAVLASTGAGRDAGGLTDEERAQFRKQALAWLKFDLFARGLAASVGGPKASTAFAAWLELWEKDRVLVPVREPEALKKLPAAERDAWAKLWADVRAARRRGQPSPPPAAPPAAPPGDTPPPADLGVFRGRVPALVRVL